MSAVCRSACTACSPQVLAYGLLLRAWPIVVTLALALAILFMKLMYGYAQNPAAGHLHNACP